nr:lytic transglycosylase domain-containing protein [Ruegeria arenilitoris]
MNLVINEMRILMRYTVILAALILTACGNEPAEPITRLYPGETPELRVMINETADANGVPRSLVHRVIQRESDYRPNARNGPYYGLMQILPATARQMGFRGQPSDLLDAQTNLTYAVRYLRGAWMVSDGNEPEAVMWYARGYYYEARNRCMLVATGLRDTEVRKYCG